MTLTAVYEQATPSLTIPVIEAPYDQVKLTAQYLLMLEIFGPWFLSYVLGMEESGGPDDRAMAVDGTSLPYHYNGCRERLELLYKVSQMILSIDCIHILRMWIIGQNPDLDYNPPAAKIRDGEFLQVLVAANTYQYGSF